MHETDEAGTMSAKDNTVSIRIDKDVHADVVAYIASNRTGHTIGGFFSAGALEKMGRERELPRVISGAEVVDSIVPQSIVLSGPPGEVDESRFRVTRKEDGTIDTIGIVTHGTTTVITTDATLDAPLNKPKSFMDEYGQEED